MAVARNTTTRDKHRRIIAQGEPPCGICGRPINYALPHTNLQSYVVDHITPLDTTGPDGDTLDNKQAAHRACNRDKSNKAAYRHGAEPVTFVTERHWWKTV